MADAVRGLQPGAARPPAVVRSRCPKSMPETVITGSCCPLQENQQLPLQPGTYPLSELPPKPLPAAADALRAAEPSIPPSAAASGDPAERRGSQDRRRQSAWSLLYGGLRPRRRAGRRTGDEQRIFLDWHEPGLLYLTLAILLMSCADALLTLNLLAAGAEELNIIMRFLLGKGPRWFLWIKIGLTACSIIVLAAAARHRILGRIPVIWLIKLCFAGYVLLICWELYLFRELAQDSGGIGGLFGGWWAD